MSRDRLRKLEGTLYRRSAYRMARAVAERENLPVVELIQEAERVAAMRRLFGADEALRRLAAELGCTPAELKAQAERHAGAEGRGTR